MNYDADNLKIDDGDVSSTTTAPGPSTHRLGNPDSTAIHSVTSQLKQSSHHSLPHDHHESTVTTSVENSRPTSPHHSPIASRYIGTHGGNNSAPPAWAAAPQGFLSNLTPEDIQVGMVLRHCLI